MIASYIRRSVLGLVTTSLIAAPAMSAPKMPADCRQDAEMERVSGINFFGPFASGESIFDSLCALNTFDHETEVFVGLGDRGAAYGFDLPYDSAAVSRAEWMEFFRTTFAKSPNPTTEEGRALRDVKRSVQQLGGGKGLAEMHPRAKDLYLWGIIDVDIDPVQIGGLSFHGTLTFRPNPGMLFAGDSIDKNDVLRELTFEKPTDFCRLNQDAIPRCDHIGDQVSVSMAYTLVGISLQAEGDDVRFLKDKIINQLLKKYSDYLVPNDYRTERDPYEFRSGPITLHAKYSPTEPALRLSYQSDLDTDGESVYGRLYRRYLNEAKESHRQVLEESSDKGMDSL